MKRKFCTAILSAIMITQSLSNVVYAQNIDESTIVKNEFIELQKMEEEGLIDDSYKQEMTEHIYKLQKEEKNTLEEMGYDENQIEAIKNFDGSDEMLERASTTVSITCQIERYEFYYTRETSNATIKVNFKVNGSFACHFEDILGIVWNDDFNILSNSYLDVTYRNSYHSRDKTIEYSHFKNGLNSAGFKFDTHISFTSDAGYLGADILSGSGYIYLTIPKKVDVVKVYTSYGHSTIGATPSFSVAGNGGAGSTTAGLGINFNTTTTDMGGETASKKIVVIDRSIAEQSKEEF